MPAFDPPWRFDPLKRAVEVGWGGSDVLVVRILASLRGHEPNSTSFEHVGFKSGPVDVWTTIDEHDDHVPVPGVVDPISNEMRAHTFMWSRPVWKRHTEDADTWRAVVLFNLRRIKAELPANATEYEFEVHLPGSTSKKEHAILYWIWQEVFGHTFEYVKAHPFTTGVVIDAEGHVAVLSIPFVPSPNSAAKRDEILGYNAGSLPPFLPFDEPIEDDVNDNFTWDLIASTYRKKLAFPVDAENRPQWDEAAAVSKKTDHGSPIIGGSPAVTVKVKVNFSTLEVTLARA